MAETSTLQPDRNRTLELAHRRCVEILGTDGVSLDAEIRRSRASSPWSAASADQAPDLVVFPQSTADVQQIIQVCHEHSLSVVGYSGGTGLGGINLSLNGGVCIDFQRMTRIDRLHEDDLDVTVQPGVGWQELNQFLAPYSLFFPPDPAPGAKIGGMVSDSTNLTRFS
jgi:D-lactate dehydrogenase (cytochrome)